MAHLVGSVHIACDSQSRGHDFQPHTVPRDNLKNKNLKKKFFNGLKKDSLINTYILEYTLSWFPFNLVF